MNQHLLHQRLVISTNYYENFLLPKFVRTTPLIVRIVFTYFTLQNRRQLGCNAFNINMVTIKHEMYCKMCELTTSCVTR